MKEWKQKTISGHYDTVFSLAHNNRTFIPKNVDPARSKYNYECVAAGQESWLDPSDPRYLHEFWCRYRELSNLYWEKRSIAQTQALTKYREHMRFMRRISYLIHPIPHDGISAMITVLLLPLIIPCDIILTLEQQRARDELEQARQDQWLLDMEYQADKCALRTALYACDKHKGTQYLHMMDAVVKEMSIKAKDYISAAQPICPPPFPQPRFATLEEIYNKLYEPSFRAFQDHQRPCRRYNGSYLQQIREGQHKLSQQKRQTKNAKSHKIAEAIEIVFGIGDMDNTGYSNALTDAKQSEVLLKDMCDHIMMQPHVCCVTTKELNDPNWQPPFKYGLIILNLTVHCDEATPGVHLTCIPYSCDCPRGPAVQAALGRAMAGMGYPSTWRDVLDEDGQRVPKRNKAGEIVYNKDGSIRYQQEPDKQGIIDWIEAQKQWLQQEMLRRYGWQREYKGSHPRGNLSTPDYQVARAKERCDEILRTTNQELHNHEQRIYELTDTLQEDVKRLFDDTTTFDLIYRYLKACPKEQFDKLLNEASDYFSGLANAEEQKVFLTLTQRIAEIDAKLSKIPSQNDNPTKQHTPTVDKE